MGFEKVNGMDRDGNSYDLKKSARGLPKCKLPVFNNPVVNTGHSNFRFEKLLMGLILQSVESK